MLRYTGYPLVDVGAVTIAAFCHKRDLEGVTLEDLDAMAQFIQEYYVREPLKSFLTSIFPNAGYVNPTMGSEKRQQEIQRCLYGYRTEVAEPQRACIFCGRPASDTVFRQHVPLITGEGIMNFGPGGKTGLKVCGVCLLCIQAFPLGSVTRCAGRVLLVHSDNPTLTYEFARLFLAQNRKMLTLADSESGAKISHPRTITVEALMKVDEGHSAARDDAIVGSLTAYHFTNYGTNADVAIYHLPLQVVDFLRSARSEKHWQMWGRLVARAWEQPRTARGGRDEAADTPPASQAGTDEWLGARRNFLYEDLFALPVSIDRFIRRYFLRYARLPDSGTAAGDHEPGTSLLSWGLTELFLRKVVNMDRVRIDRIREVGDRLATVIADENDTRLLKELYGKSWGAPGYRALRTALVKASMREVKAGKPTIISFDDFITIFEEGEDAPRVDWALARDLMFIRVLDTLYARGWFKQHPEAAQEVADRAEEMSTEAEQTVAAV